MPKICPILNIDGPACYKEECAWWVESSQMCAVKDLAQSTRASNEMLQELIRPELKASVRLMGSGRERNES